MDNGPIDVVLMKLVELLFLKKKVELNLDIHQREKNGRSQQSCQGDVLINL